MPDFPFSVRLGRPAADAFPSPPHRAAVAKKLGRLADRLADLDASAAHRVLDRAIRHGEEGGGAVSVDPGERAAQVAADRPLLADVNRRRRELGLAWQDLLLQLRILPSRWHAVFYNGALLDPAERVKLRAFIDGDAARRDRELEAVFWARLTAENPADPAAACAAAFGIDLADAQVAFASTRLPLAVADETARLYAYGLAAGGAD